MRVSSQDITGALTALAADRVSKVTLHAPLTLEALGVEQTLEALPGVRVAVPLGRAVPVVGAVTRLTHAPRQLGVTMEVVSTDVTPNICHQTHGHNNVIIPVPRVPIVTVADGLHGLVVKVASLGVAVAAGPGAGAQTLSAGNLVLTELRSSVVSNLDRGAQHY